MENKIIDVSSNNGIIDWNEVVNDGVSDVIIRLSLGYGDKDTLAGKYAKEAASVGLRVSYYHLGYPDKRPGTLKADAKQEANYFTGLFLGGLLPSPYLLAVDLEKMANGWDTPLNKTEYSDWVTIFLSEVYASTGLICMIYSNRPYLDAHLPTTHQLGRIPLWLSNYNNVPTPPLPIGWSQYFLWQFTDSGLVRGIATTVDMSRFYHSIHLEKLVLKIKKRKKK